MTQPIETQVPLVGRATELDRLEGLVGLDGEAGASVLLGGEAGVGKTRLLAELCGRARNKGVRVMAGHCLDFGESALPYLPLSEAFGRLAADEPALVGGVVTAAPAVARLMPARRLRPDEDARTPRVTDGADPLDRAELFESVHAALQHLGRAAPLLLVVEDVHWADRSTREMLTFLLTRGFTEPVSLVVSYRTDDLHRRHPLRAGVAEWTRLPGVVRVELARLPDSDVRALVRALHPAPLSEHALRGIVARAEGNAFFTEELVAAASDGAAAVPVELADLLLVRLEQLDETSRQVVRAAAVSGRRVPHALLARVVGAEPSVLEGALRAAVEHNILVAVGGDAYSFRHALLAEAVYDDLLPGERTRLHAAYADALATGDIPGTSAELARHASAAHDLATAARASAEAGEEAAAVGAPDEAAQHYERALELVSRPEVADALRDQGHCLDPVELTIHAVRAATAAGGVLRAIALAQDQLNALPPDAPPALRARLLHLLASAGVQADSGPDVLALTTEALELVPDDEPRLRARLLALRARATASRGRHEEALRWAADALALARELGLSEVESDAATTLARLGDAASDPDQARATLEAAVATARSGGLVVAELRALINLGLLHAEAGELSPALDVFRATVARARELGRPWAPYALDARVMASQFAYVMGQWDESARLADATGEAPPDFPAAYLTAAGLAVRAGRGDDGAVPLLEQVRPWWAHEGLIAVFTGAAAIDLFGDRGDVDAAIRVHDAVVEAATALWSGEEFHARVRLSALLIGQLATAAARASTATRLAQVDRGAELVEVARSISSRAASSPRGFGPEGMAWWHRAEAEHLRLRWLAGAGDTDHEKLLMAWQECVERFERLGHVFEVARSQARTAAVLRALGRGAESAALVTAATTTARALGAQPLLTELRALGGVPSPRVSRTGTGAVRHDEALTAREREVLGLVAQGRSNRQIADQLFISAKTVSVHVSNILAKLGASGRTEAVAVARRLGLLTEA